MKDHPTLKELRNELKIMFELYRDAKSEELKAVKVTKYIVFEEKYNEIMGKIDNIIGERNVNNKNNQA